MAKNKPTASSTPSPTDRDYVANWRVDNIAGEVLEIGDTITLEQEVAAPFVDAGCLSEVPVAEEVAGN